MNDIYESDELYLATGTPKEVAAALADAEQNFAAAKETYREDKSEENREAHHDARDNLQRWRRATRNNTMTITAEQE